MTTSGWRWQDKAAGGGMMDETHPVRRVAGISEIRFDGIADLLLRAHGCSVFDVGCNRGHVGWDFAMNGAKLVHGCDIDAASIQCARMWFSEHPHVEARFEVVDLRKPDAIREQFGTLQYDIVLFLGVLHKLNREMHDKQLRQLIADLGSRAKVYFAWNGKAADLATMDSALRPKLKRVQTSELAFPGQPAAIWRRQ